MHNLTFQYPWVLWFLFLVPLLVAWYIFRYRKQKAALQFSNIGLFKGFNKTLRQRLRHLPYALRMVAVMAIIVALARPQSQLSREEMNVDGIDIVLAIDVSGSMMAEDFKPTRLEAAKSVAAEFINGRLEDRIGLVVFAGEAFTQVPVTIDHHILLSQLGAVKSGTIRDGTALGDGLAVAINRIKNSEAKSKVIILLTDGVNNQGSIDPRSAAEMAAMYGIRLYTIGVGTNGRSIAHAPDGTRYNVDCEIDEKLLEQMATTTDDGQYFRAKDKKALKSIFSQIDDMEKTKINVTQYRQTKDEFMPFLMIAVIAFALELLLGMAYFRTTP